jgi:hypothetical protein
MILDRHIADPTVYSSDFFLGAFANLRKAIISFVMTVRPSIRLPVSPSAWNNSVPTGRISIKLDISAFFRKSVSKI